jgi:opacity protein-like surface antigen
MGMKVFALSAAAAALSVMGAQSAAADPAQSGPYIGATYSTINFSDADVRVGAIGGRVGWRIGPNFAIEGEGAFGVQDDTVTVLGVDVNAELDSAWAIFAVGALPVSSDATVFGRIGWASAEVTASVPGVSLSESDDGFAAGVGGTVNLSDHWALRADYTYIDENVHSLGAGVQLSF